MNEVVQADKSRAIIDVTEHKGLMPRNFEGLWRMATIMSASGFMPKNMEKVESVFIAVTMGLELGLSPMQAVQSISVINGRPCVWGDAVIGLVQGSNLLEEMREYFENEAANYPENMTAICQVKRKGGREVIQKFSVADAKRANLWGKAGPWTQYPRRLLQMRARGFALRDLFPDVLKGLKMAEEVMDYDLDLKPGRNGVYQAVVELPTEDNSELYKPKKVVEQLTKEPPVVEAKPQEPEKPVVEAVAPSSHQESSQNGNAEPAPVKEEDPQTRFDNYFRAKWINLRKPGFSDFVWKNPADFKKASDSVRQEARTKWSEFYPHDKFPPCIALAKEENGTTEPPPVAEEKSPPVAEDLPVSNFQNTEEYKEYFQACNIDPSLAEKAREKVFGQDREPDSAGELKAVMRVFNLLIDEVSGPGF